MPQTSTITSRRLSLDVSREGGWGCSGFIGKPS
jgi:hypothetical protein